MVFTGSTPIWGNQAGISCPVGTPFSPLHPTLYLLTCNVHCFIMLCLPCGQLAVSDVFISYSSPDDDSIPFQNLKRSYRISVEDE